MIKLKIIKKILKYQCYCCQSNNQKKIIQRKCKICDKTGFFKDEIYYHIITDKKGNKYCFDGDSLK